MNWTNPRVSATACLRLALAVAATAAAAFGARVDFQVLSVDLKANTSCALAGSAQTGAGGCGVSGGAGDASIATTDLAPGSGLYEHGRGLFEDGFFLSASAFASFQTDPFGEDQRGSAEAEITATVLLRTEGPVRSGFADFYALGGGFGCGAPSCSAWVALDSLVFSDLGGYRSAPDVYTVPVLLGTDMTLTLRAFASDGDPGRGLSASTAGIDIRFREAPQTRLFAMRAAVAAPQIAQTPEPAGLVMLLSGLLGLMLLSRWTVRR